MSFCATKHTLHRCLEGSHRHFMGCSRDRRWLPLDGIRCAVSRFVREQLPSARNGQTRCDQLHCDGPSGRSRLLPAGVFPECRRAERTSRGATSCRQSEAAVWYAIFSYILSSCFRHDNPSSHYILSSSTYHSSSEN